MSALTPAALAPAAPDATCFVLVRPSHAGNVGAVARAIHVMGFSRLVLVAPRFADVAGHAEAVAMASAGAAVLAASRVVPSLDEALADMTHACATAMTPRDFGPPTLSPRAFAEAWAARLQGPGQRLAFVFGCERHGLSNDDVRRCHACLTIPTADDQGSLNLAQAVQLIAYEWRQALGAWPVRSRNRPEAPGTLGELDAALAHWQTVLAHAGFLNPQVPKKLMPRLRRLLLRAQPSREELHILRGIARAVDPGPGGPR